MASHQKPTSHALNRARVLTYTTIPYAFQACWEKTVRGELELEVVFAPGTVTTFSSDQRSVEQAREMVDSGQVSFYIHEEGVPYVVIIPDDEGVLLCLSGESGETRAVIDTEDETVREWAESTFESYRDESIPLDSSQLRV